MDSLGISTLQSSNADLNMFIQLILNCGIESLVQHVDALLILTFIK